MYLKDDHPWQGWDNLPGHVRSEPKLRGARTSGYRPRRTISPMSPLVPPWRSGYALPSNVKRERPGRAPKTTRQRPRGATDVRLPDGLGSSDGNRLAEEGKKIVGTRRDPIANFGRSAAAEIIRESKQVGEPARSAFLRDTLHTIDPTLPRIVQARAENLQKEKGYSPDKAFRRALAASLANQLLTETIGAGRSGRAPTSGLLGLGGGPRCGSPLGTIMHTMQVDYSSRTATPPPDQCPPGQEWSRRGNRCVVPSDGGGCPAGTVRVVTRRDPLTVECLPADCPEGQIPKITPGDPPTVRCAVPTDRPLLEADLQVGPFMFYAEASAEAGWGRPAVVDHRGLNADQRSYMKPAIEEANKLATVIGRATLGGKVEKASDLELDAWAGIDPDMPVLSKLFDGSQPIAKFRHPVNNERWGLYLEHTPNGMSAIIKKRPRSRLQRLWDGIKDLPKNVVKWVKKAAEAVGKAVKEIAKGACKALSTPEGQLAAAGGAAIAGAPPDQAIVGAQVGAALCDAGKPQPAPLMPQPAPMPGWVMPAAIVGGLGVVALVILR